MTNQINFSHAEKRTRGELRLPQQHFVAMDDWVDKLGEKAYVAWLKFYTWADRRNADRENDVIPNSMNGICKKMGVSKETFYRKIIPALWNFGLIDFEERELNGNTYLNIVVYEYPQNRVELATKPLEKIRDYETEWNTANRENAKKGGRKKEPIGGSEIEPGGGSEIEPVTGGSEIEPGGGSEIEPINVSNAFNNFSNIDDEEDEEEASPTAIASPRSFFALSQKLRISEKVADNLYLSVKDSLSQYSNEALERTFKKFRNRAALGKISNMTNWFSSALANEQMMIEQMNHL